MTTVTDIDLPRRIAARIYTGPTPADPLVNVPGACWHYNGFHSASGYPYATANRKYQPAHRAVWFYLTGDPLEGLDLDHVCRNTRCVNPEHMEPVTHAENMRRLSLAQNACRRDGHDWTQPENVRVRADGSRYCAECDRVALRERYMPTGRPQNGTQANCKHGHPFDAANTIHYTNPTTGRTQRRCRACIRRQVRKES